MSLGDAQSIPDVAGFAQSSEGIRQHVVSKAEGRRACKHRQSVRRIRACEGFDCCCQRSYHGLLKQVALPIDHDRYPASAQPFDKIGRTRPGMDQDQHVGRIHRAVVWRFLAVTHPDGGARHEGCDPGRNEFVLEMNRLRAGVIEGRERHEQVFTHLFRIPPNGNQPFQTGCALDVPDGVQALRIRIPRSPHASA